MINIETQLSSVKAAVLSLPRVQDCLLATLGQNVVYGPIRNRSIALIAGAAGVCAGTIISVAHLIKPLLIAILLLGGLHKLEEHKNFPAIAAPQGKYEIVLKPNDQDQERVFVVDDNVNHVYTIEPTKERERYKIPLSDLNWDGQINFGKNQKVEFEGKCYDKEGPINIDLKSPKPQPIKRKPAVLKTLDDLPKEEYFKTDSDDLDIIGQRASNLKK